jgi:hypothetical protein
MAVTAAFFLSTTAYAQQGRICGPRQGVLDQLADKYGEATIAAGIGSNGGMIEVLSAKDGATWTIIMSMPNGTSCVMATGESWRARNRPQIPKEPAV